LQEAESMGNSKAGNFFESIIFNALLDAFIKVENAALQ
jgi:hypothetical protein